MRKYLTKYYRWRYDRLRKKFGQKYEDKHYFAAKLNDEELEQYEAAGLRWYRSSRQHRHPVNFVDAPLGRDITFDPFNMDEIREAIGSQNRYRGDWTDKDWNRSGLRVGVDTSTKVDVMSYSVPTDNPEAPYLGTTVIRNGELDVPQWMNEDQAIELQRQFEENYA